MRQNDRENEDSCNNLSSAWRAALSGSSASAILRLFPQPLHVAHGWDTEEAFVLPIEVGGVVVPHAIGGTDRKSTRLNSSHGSISYAVFCLKKKKSTNTQA